MIRYAATGCPFRRRELLVVTCWLSGLQIGTRNPQGLIGEGYMAAYGLACLGFSCSTREVRPLQRPGEQNGCPVLSGSQAHQHEAMPKALHRHAVRIAPELDSRASSGSQVTKQTESGRETDAKKQQVEERRERGTEEEGGGGRAASSSSTSISVN